MISKSQIKHIQSLHTKKQRERDQCFIAEGVKLVKEIIHEKPLLIKNVFCTQQFISENEKLLKNKKIIFNAISEKELSQISLLSTPNNVLAICNTFETHPVSINFNTHFSFYLDNISDPGNLGTIIRICSWFGIKELFCSPNSVELYNPKCIQSTMGSFLRVHVHYIHLSDLMKQCKIQHVYATEVEGENIFNTPYKNGLIIIGNEANGISEPIKKLANQSLSIPSAKGNTESLNAAIATSIIAAEFFRRSL